MTVKSNWNAGEKFSHSDANAVAAQINANAAAVASAAAAAAGAQATADTKQPVDSDLTAFAALNPADDTLVQRKGGVWTARTPAQVKTDLALGNVDNTADASKPVSTAQAAADAATLTTATGRAIAFSIALG